MIDFISSLVASNELATFILSFFPLIELKGGIVFGWESLGFFKTFILAYLGSTLAFFVVFLLLKPVINLLKKIKFLNNFALRIEEYFKNKAESLLEKQNGKNTRIIYSETTLKMFLVFVFVAIPLPMTGVWTGSAIAVFLNLPLKNSVIPVCLGNLIAGLLICLLSIICTAVGISLDLVLICLLVLALVLLVLTCFKVFKKK